jgi:hypothetical protein
MLREGEDGIINTIMYGCTGGLLDGWKGNEEFEEEK